MFSSEEIWTAVDALARRIGISTSRLALAAGMDPTALNKSKRRGADGKPRWISTETMAKILTATSTSPHEFVDLMCGPRPYPTRHEFTAPSRLGRSDAKAAILLVDPDEEFSQRMATELGAAGYEVEVAPDLQHALEAIETGRPLDLLVANLELPDGAHGRTLARIALICRPGLKTILISNSSMLPRAGLSADLLLQKPLEDGGLAGAVGRVLGSAAGEKQLHATEAYRVGGAD